MSAIPITIEAAPALDAPARATGAKAVALYVAIVLLAALGALGYKLRGTGLFACPGTGYGGDRYLAYCNAGSYGDFDHGAFWFGLDAGSREQATKAKVLMVGNSRLQFGLSTAATARWFGDRQLPYYLLGFSHSETSRFFAPLLDRLKPQAKLYVLNVDGLFDERTSEPAQAVLQSGHDSSRYVDKLNWQPAHEAVCGRWPSLCGQAYAVYRSRADGSWRLHGEPESKLASSIGDVAPGRAMEAWPQRFATAKAFVDALPVDRGCVVLTMVPTRMTRRDEAKAIAASLGLELVAPQLPGLRTFDGSHLDAASAERWSQAFLAAAGPRIEACLRQAR